MNVKYLIMYQYKRPLNLIVYYLIVSKLVIKTTLIYDYIGNVYA